MDEYEQYRGNRGIAKRLRMKTRHKMLMEWGVSVSQISQAAKKSQLVKEQRHQTIDGLVEVPIVKNWLLQKLINILFI